RGIVSLENHPPLSSRVDRLYLKIAGKITRRPAQFVSETVILRSLKKNKIDVVLIEYGNHAHSLLSLLKKSKLPFVVHFHGYDATTVAIQQATGNYKEVFAHASKIIAVSKSMESLLLDLGCPSE